MMLSSMVVNNFDINYILAKKSKANTPLIVDSNAPLTTALSYQGFETITRRNPQLVDEIYPVENCELS